ncbi:YIP1 family protein [Parasedimentitalea psychrophila]|nr:YIP1 family protein [Parasedimentitalea psychrophila]
MILHLQPLVMMTLTSPAQAARSILSVPWPRQLLWSAMVLAIALNAIIYSAQEILFPLPSEVVFPRLSPLGYFAVVLVLQVVFVFALQASGRWLGGQGKFDELLAVVVWLQLLQVALQLAMTVLFLVAPSLAGILNLAATLFGLFIFSRFINEVHQLQSIWRAFGALLMASIIIALALSFLLGLVGPSFLGLSANV